VTSLDELLGLAGLPGLMALASAAAGGAPIGLVDPEGHVVAGRSAGPVVERAHPVMDGERTVATLVAAREVAPELMALSLELLLAGARDEADRARIGHEVAIGRRIQTALLPRRFPDLEAWTFAAHYEPAREVSGDLFDVFGVRGQLDRVALVIADVTGKGVPAALLMADVKALLHAAIDNADGPADALRRVNTVLVRERATSLFVTAALLVIETSTGNVAYASAGHEPPLVARRSGSVDTLEAGGPILGAFADAEFEERVASIGLGDSLTLYTDGITEARDEARRFYGESRLLAALGAACGLTAGEIARTIVTDVESFRGEAEPFDDIALLVIERRPTGGPAAH
jgi:phosphoserine phosphatase RsbU/P